MDTRDIYELNGSPCIYFKSVGAEPSPQQLATWHRAAWNHGLARMLWICTPTHIRVFNAFAPPPEHLTGLEAPEVLLFKGVADQLDVLKESSLTRQQIESGEFWFGPIGRRITRKTRIDEQLVEDLEMASRRLTERGLESIQAHRLLLRTIFIAYLEAKHILPQELFENLGVERFEHILSSTEKTEIFFGRMREIFNGDLFPPPPTEAFFVHDLTPAQLEIPQCILARTDLNTWQQSLHFWRYDFSVIPIELISSIYEKFIYAADPDKAKKMGTHYTPIHLVDFVLSQVFDDTLFGSQLPARARVLDLACGSGVFLVEALRRLVAQRLANGEKHTRALVRDALYNQVFGLDVENTAIEIAAFSLCLTAFELDPTPSATLHLKFRQQLKGRNLFVDNAFDPDAAFLKATPFTDSQFDMIVGNPPWTRAKGPRSSNPAGEQLHVVYCQNRQPTPVPLPFRNPPEQAFIWRAQDFARTGARLGMILEGKRFFSHEAQSLAAKRALLKSFQPRLMVNLANLHDQKLFPTTKQPAMILIAENTASSPKATFPFVAVEFSRTFREHGILQIGPENVECLSVSLAATNQYALKVASWGNARDMALINRLVGQFDAFEQFLARHNVAMHQGFIQGNRSRSVPAALHGKPCLSGGTMPPFLVDAQTLPLFNLDALEHPRDPSIYRGPLLLCARSLRGNRIVAAFCQDDVVFSRSQFGVSFPHEIQWIAHYLNGVLNSSLATYFTFLTATRWGLDKYVITNTDLLRLPIPQPERADATTVETILAIERELRQPAQEGKHDTSVITALDQAVFALYGLDATEQILVEDMLLTTIDIQRNHEDSAALRPATSQECHQYAQQLIGVMQPFFETRKQRTLTAEIFDVEGPLRVVRFRIIPGAESQERRITVITVSDLDAILEHIAATLDERIALNLYTRRHLRIYAEDAFYIVKPSARRFWSRTAGLVDGDAVLRDVFSGGNSE